MMKKRFFFLLLLFAVVLSHPTSEIPDGSGSYAAPEFDLVFNEDITDEDLPDTRRAEALMKLQQIFGIPEPTDRSRPHKIPPQFMIELYNTIADPSGVTRGKNPYNAKIVRSFIERDSSMSHYYLFNITGLEMNESVLEAELHLYRKRTPLKSMHPAVLSSPYYLIRVYQVLDEHQLDIPDLHRLLNVHYVGAHASGWQVFNVKQAVLSWMSGAPNLGLLVTASNLFGDDAAVHFSRRNEHRHSKQPILVLFDDDGKETPAGENIVPHYYKYENDLKEEDADESAGFDVGGTDPDDSSSLESGGFERQKRDTTSKKRQQRIVSKDGKIAGALSSVDIYERAMIRKKLSRSRKVATDESKKRQRKSRSTPEVATPTATEPNATECARHMLYVDFKEIGWSDFIIAPAGYSAYHCKGHCNFPLSQGQHPTNHATVQSIVHMLRQGKDVNQPCCVPTKLLSISLLYFLDDGNVVLKLYQDMVADRCGCH